METQDKLRQDYVKTQDPRDKEELLRIADAYDAGYKAGLERTRNEYKDCVIITERNFTVMQAKIDQLADAIKKLGHIPQEEKLVDGWIFDWGEAGLRPLSDFTHCKHLPDLPKEKK